MVFDVEQETISLLLTNADPILGSKSHYRMLPAFFSCGETLYVMGGSRTYIGSDEDGEGGHYWDDELNDCWSLDLITATWHKIDDSCAVFVGSQHALVAPNGSVIVIKSLRNGFSMAKGWLTAPPLTDLAWAALLNRFPKVLGLSVEEQLKLGIPKHLQWAKSGVGSEASEQVSGSGALTQI